MGIWLTEFIQCMGVGRWSGGGGGGRPVGVGEASASPLFSYQITYAVQYSSSLTSHAHIVNLHMLLKLYY